MLGREQERNRATQYLLGGVTEKFLGARVPGGDHAVQGPRKNRVLRGLHNGRPFGVVISEQLPRQFVVRGTVCVIVGHVAVLGAGIGLSEGVAVISSRRPPSGFLKESAKSPFGPMIPQES